MGQRHSKNKGGSQSSEDAHLQKLENELKQAQMAQNVEQENIDVLAEELKYEKRMMAIEAMDDANGGPGPETLLDGDDVELEIDPDELLELEAELLAVFPPEVHESSMTDAADVAQPRLVQAALSAEVSAAHSVHSTNATTNQWADAEDGAEEEEEAMVPANAS